MQRQPEADNLDHATVEGFGQEWSAYDQSGLVGEEYRKLFDGYFRIFPFDELPPNAEGFDLGCGSGRWAAGVAPRVGILHCIDPSEQALAVAKQISKIIQMCAFIALRRTLSRSPTTARISVTRLACCTMCPTRPRR